MDRDIPTFNRSVMERIYSKNHELHLKRLKEIKSGISSHKSYNKPSYSNLVNSNSIIATNYHSKLPQYHNPKRECIEEINNNKIERENQLLFKKMLKIMKRPDKNNDPTAPKYHVTENAAKQRMSMEFSRINEQNKTLFHRLEQQKPTIDMKKIQQQRMKNLQILKFLGKYPNQQAMLRASQQQFQTFDLRSRKMNSTSNRMNYNNPNRQPHEGQEFFGEERFRNEMEGYDRELKELRDETRRAASKNSRTIQKFTATSSGNYYNPRRAVNSSSHHNNNATYVNTSSHHKNDMSYDMGNEPYNNYKEQYANNQLGHLYQNNHNPNTLSPDQPIPPARRKFLSQGGHRQAAYDPRGRELSQYDRMNTHLNDINQNNYHQEVVDQEENSQPREFQKYPYHLNHPSNNIVIQDRLQNYYTNNNNKRKTLQNVREKKGISNNNTYIHNTNPTNTNTYTNSNSINTNSYAGINTYNSYNKHPVQQPLKPNVPKAYLAPKNSAQNNLQRKLNKKNSQSHLQQPEHTQAQPSVKPQFMILPEQFYHESMQEQDEEYFETEPSPQRVNKHIQLSTNPINFKNIHQTHKPTIKNQQNMILLYKTSIQLGKLLVKQQVQEIANDIYRFIAKENSTIHVQLKIMGKVIMSMLSQQLRQISIYRLPQCYKITISNQNPSMNNQPNKKRYQQHSQKNIRHQNHSNIDSTQQIDPLILQTVKKYLQNALLSVEQLEIPEEQGSLLLQDIDYNYKHFIQHMVKVEKNTQEHENQQHFMNQRSLFRLVIVLGQEQEVKQQSRVNLQDRNSNHKPNYHPSQNPSIKQHKKQPSTHENPIQVPQNTLLIKNTSQQPQSLTKQARNNLDSDEQQALSKPQAVCSNIPTVSSNIPTGINGIQSLNREKSIYVEALDQQVV